MLEDLNLREQYDGFLFLADAARKPPRRNSHHHVELELNLVVRGAITYVVGVCRYTFPQGSLLWFFPAQEHQLVDRSEAAQNYVAVFKPSLIERSCRSAAYKELNRKSLRKKGVLHAVLEPSIFDLVRRMMESVSEGTLDPYVTDREAGVGLGSNLRFEHNDPDGLNAGLHHLLLLCWRKQMEACSRCAEVPLHPAVGKALRLLSEGDLHLNLGALARKCGVSPAYLSRIFVDQVGVPLNHYRNNMRLAHFWEHHRGAEQKTITESMYAAGFGSYAQFYNIFARVHGCGPRECLQRS